MIVSLNGNGDGRPLTHSSIETHAPYTASWGRNPTLELYDFQLPKLCDFRLPLTYDWTEATQGHIQTRALQYNVGTEL